MPTDSFVPLISIAPTPSGDSADFQATVLSQPEQAQKFNPVELAAAAASPGKAADGSPCEPRVTLQRDGEQVTGIRIQCSCGQVIDLACVYPAEKVS
ncbi:MAG TPA: hypothetical protein VG938_15685 [Verrucomicrobiae bacterium]|jgi:hypothetical protein|nr:hypothetical protein [Verrucomicrobiae bacterium]